MAGGYVRFTMESVAERAQTSRAVLYRRWPQRWDLISAAVRRYQETNPVAVPDTGSLREDLVTYLRDTSRKRAEFAAIFTLGMASLYEESGASPADLREELTRGRVMITDTIFDRAVTRGEIDGEGLTRRVRDLPFDLLRNELIMHLRPVPDEVIDAIVDEVVLPLVSRR